MSVGQAVGGIVGGVVGFFVGGPAGAVKGFQYGYLAGSIIDPPKGPTINGPRLSDLSVQTSTYGAPIPRIYGTVAVHGNVFWLEGNSIREVSRRQRQGGKGGGGASVRTYSYFATFAVGLCDTTVTGPIAGVRRVWVGAKLIYDASSLDLETIVASNRSAMGFRIYSGDEAQLPDPRMQADMSGSCPAFRGLAYIVFYDLPLEDYGNSLLGAQVKVEVVSSLTTSFAFVSSREVPRAAQAHPASSAIGAPITESAEAVFVERSDFGQPAAVYLVRASQTATYRQPLVFDSLIPGSDFSNLSPISASLQQMHFTFEWANRYAVWGRDASVSGTFDAGTSQAEINAIAESPDALYIAVHTPFNPPIRRIVKVGKTGAWDFASAMATLNIASTSEPVIVFWNDMVALIERGSATSGQLVVKLYDEELDALLDEFTLAVGNSHLINSQDCSAAVRGDEAFVVCREGPDPSGALIDRINLAQRQYVATLTPQTGHKDPPISPRKPTVTIQGGLLSIGGRTSNGFRYLHYLIDAPAVSSVSLSSIVSGEVLQSRLIEAGDIDATALTQFVKGYRSSAIGSIRAAIDPLQGAWPFDVVQRGYTIHFVPRGQPPVVTISDGELGAREASDDVVAALSISTEMESQLPRVVRIKYLDVQREYDLNEQSAERATSSSVNIRDIELPIVLDADEAAGMAEVLLHLYWLERREVTFVLPPSRRALEPGDVILVSSGQGQFELRLLGTHLLSDGRLECQARFNSPAIYSAAASGQEGISPQGTIPLPGRTLYQVMDIPAMRSEFDVPGVAAAAAGTTLAWPGGLLYRSADSGQTWADVAAWDAPATLGIARNVVPSGRFDIVDSASALRVDLVFGEISSITEESLLAGQNLCAYGAPGRWEIIGIKTAELQADGSLLLRDLLRGRYGTEAAAASHQVGDALVLLTDPEVQFVGLDSAAIGRTQTFRGITAGQGIDSASSQSMVYEAVNLKPLSPVYLNGNRHPTTRDWTLTCIRRGRLSAEWRDLVDVPLSEAVEQYEVVIHADSSFGAAVRTIQSNSTAIQYTSAQQVADFGSNQATLHVSWFQISSTVGRGFPLRVSITRG